MTVPSLILLILPAYNYTKLVHLGDNPKKKTLMYIPCVSCNHRLSSYLQIEKGLEVRVSPIDRLDASTLSGGNPRSEVAIRTSEWGKSQQRSDDPNLRVRKIPAAESGSQLPPSRGNPISGAMTPIRTWSGVSPIDRLDASTLSWKNPSSEVVIRTSEWGKSQQRSRVHNLLFRVGEIPSVEL